MLPELHVILTSTELTTVPLWMLKSDGLRQQAALAAFDKNNTDGAALGELGLGALANRDYARAAELFAGSIGAEGRAPRLQILALYSLFMTKDSEGRREMVQTLKEAGSASPVDPWVVTFLEQRVASR